MPDLLFNTSQIKITLIIIILSFILFFLIYPKRFSIFMHKVFIFHNEHGMKWFYLTAIIIFAFLLRFIKLDKIPLGLYWDEALFGYNAYCIAETGRDETNHPWPIFFKIYGYYLSGGVYYYCVALLIKIFGPTIFALRFTSCILGILTLFFSYKLVKLYFNKPIALISALLIAVSPWNIQISRVAMDPSALPFFFVLSFYLLSLGLFRNKIKYILLSAIPIGLCFYCYATARFFVPMFYIFFLCLNRKKLTGKKQTIITWAIIIALILSPHINYKLEELQNRFNGFSIFSQQSIEHETGELQRSNLAFLANSKTTVILSRFIKNYFMHMSFNFFLKNGDYNLRHHVGGRGQLLWFTFWMQIVGIIYVLYKRQMEFYIFPLWFALFPVAASLTTESLPHAGRSVYSLPIFEILAAIGFYFLITYTAQLFKQQNIKKGILLSLVLILIVVKGVCDTNNYLKDYFNNYALRAAPWFNYDVYAIINATQNMKEYDKFIMPECDLYEDTILFLQKIKPEKWQRREIELKYTRNYPSSSEICDKRIARIVKPSLDPEEKAIGFVHHETTGEIMYEIKELKCDLKK